MIDCICKIILLHLLCSVLSIKGNGFLLINSISRFFYFLLAFNVIKLNIIAVFILLMVCISMIISKPYSNPEDEPEYLGKPLLSARQVMQLLTGKRGTRLGDILFK